MKKSRFTPEQIARILKEFDMGKTAEEITRECRISKAAFQESLTRIVVEAVCRAG